MDAPCFQSLPPAPAPAVAQRWYAQWGTSNTNLVAVFYVPHLDADLQLVLDRKAHMEIWGPPCTLAAPAQSQDNQTSPSTEEEERLWAVRPDPRLLALVLGITSVMGAEDLRDRDGENAGHCLALLSHLRRQEAGGFQHMNRQVSSRTCCLRPRTWSTGRSGSSAAPR